MFYVLSKEYRSVQAMTVSAFASDGFRHPRPDRGSFYKYRHFWEFTQYFINLSDFT